jgi:peptidoglycan/LPS O-acetylase OafA/YrhL
MGVFRLFLALSVLLGHTRGHGFLGLSFVYSEIAVQTFFIISGFYMALVLNEKYNQPGDYGTFIQQRFLRLYPTYLILISMVVVVDAIVYAVSGQPWGSLKSWVEYHHLMSPQTLAALVVENIIIFGQDIVMLVTMDPANGTFHLFWTDNAVKPVAGSYFLLIGSSWSLSVEFMFYLVAPFLVRRPWRTQLVIFLICFAVRAGIYLTLQHTAGQDAYHWIYCVFPANLFFFMAGSLGYVLYKNYHTQFRSFVSSKPWVLLPFIIFGLDYCRYPRTSDLYLLWMPLVFIMVPVLFAVTSRSRIDRLIGELSYPCYLIHPHVLIFTVPLFLHTRREWMLGPVSFAITLLLCVLFYLLIESRTERFREGLYRKAHPKSYVQPPPSREAETPASSLN